MVVMRLLMGYATFRSWTRVNAAMWFFPLSIGVSIMAFPVNAQTTPAVGPHAALPNDFTIIDAVRQALALDPNIRIAEQTVRASQGAIMALQGDFDLTLSGGAGGEHTRYPLNPFDQLSLNAIESDLNILTFNNRIGKKLRSGTVLGLSTSVVRRDDRNNSSIGLPINATTVAFTLTMPLLSGRGAGAPAAFERAALIDAKATELMYRRTVETRVFATVDAYWSFVAAESRLVALQAAEKNAQNGLDRVRRLIEGKELAPAEIHQMMANVEQYRTQRIAGERDLFEAKQKLGMAMGLQAVQIAEISRPVTSLEQFAPERITASVSASKLISLALERRTDYLAAQKSEEASATLVAAAKKNLQPQLELGLSAGYAGIEERATLDNSSAILSRNQRGANARIQLTYLWPIEKTAGRGILIQREADRDQKGLLKDQLSRSIAIDIAIALDAIQKDAEELKCQFARERYFQTTVENEKKKFELGSSSVFNIITYEDHLASAVLDRIGAQQNLAKAVSRLRLETGTLIDASDGADSVSIDNLMTVPEAR
jgi:outer membrane protein